MQLYIVFSLDVIITLVLILGFKSFFSLKKDSRPLSKEKKIVITKYGMFSYLTVLTYVIELGIYKYDIPITFWTLCFLIQLRLVWLGFALLSVLHSVGWFDEK